jgi:hypothetical protein
MASKPLSQNVQVIRVHVAELRQMFNSMDPAPFHARDLDPAAEVYIVESANDLPHKAALALSIHVDDPAEDPGEQAVLRESISRYFENRSQSTRRQLRLLFRRGRASLLIGIAFLTSSVIAGEMVSQALTGNPFADVIRESLLIGGWVAMWRPLQIFLYDWWPLRADIRLFMRLRDMPVTIQHGAQT